MALPAARSYLRSRSVGAPLRLFSTNDVPTASVGSLFSDIQQKGRKGALLPKAPLHELLRRVERPEDLRHAVNAVSLYEKNAIAFKGYTAAAFVDACIRCGDPKGALERLIGNKALRQVVSAGTLRKLVAAFRDQDDLEGCFQVLKVSKGTKKGADKKIYYETIRLCERQGETERALQLLEELCKRDVRPSPGAVQSVLRGASNSENAETVRQRVQQVIERSGVQVPDMKMSL